ncbi:unnamed protein product, partial [Musa banksii]
LIERQFFDPRRLNACIELKIGLEIIKCTNPIQFNRYRNPAANEAPLVFSSSCWCKVRSLIS